MEEVVADNSLRKAFTIKSFNPLAGGVNSLIRQGAKDELMEICYNRAYELYGHSLPAPVKERLIIELDQITRYGDCFATIYIIARLFTLNSKEKGYHTCCRGAGGSSFAAYLAGITRYNPLPPHYRCKRCRHSDFAIPDDVKAGYDLPLKNCPHCGAEMIGDGVDIPSETFLGYFGDKVPGFDLSFAEEEMDDTLLYAEKLLGEGHIFHKDPNSTSKNIDLFAYPVLTKFRFFERFTGINILDVPLNDPKVYKLFTSPESPGASTDDIKCNTGTLGLPEMATEYVRDVLTRTKPSCFADLIKVSGLTHSTGGWSENAEELILTGTCTVADVIGCRDDVMQTLERQYSLEHKDAFVIMENVRKGRGIPPEHEKLMKDHGVPEWYIESCRKFRYLFPKAHAVELVISALIFGWFKLYHPVEFYAALFSGESLYGMIETIVQGLEAVEKAIKAGTAADTTNDSLELLCLARECFKRGIDFLPADSEKSDPDVFLPENGSIRMPLRCKGHI